MARGNWLAGVVCGAVAGFGVLAAAAPAAEPKEGVGLTVYTDFAVVSETRSVEIPAGGDVAMTNVAALIDPTTVRFESLTDPSAKILEQNFQYDIVSPSRLLEKYLDKKITVRCDKETCTGTLLSFQESNGLSPWGGTGPGTVAQLVLKDDKGGLVLLQGTDIRGIQFGQMPEGLRTRPTLLWKVATQKPGKQLGRLSYQTGGMAWHAEYTLVVDPKDEHADLAGWVSVDNTSGVTYPEAILKFVAGQIRRERSQSGGTFQEEPSLGGGGGEKPAMAEKAFFEYHMYTLQRPSTLADKETKQLELFAPVQGVAVTKRYLYNPLGAWRWQQDYHNLQDDKAFGADKADSKVGVFVEFVNTKQNKLGIPLPAGKVGVYKPDPAGGSLALLGEKVIEHTPADEMLSLEVGNAFDLVGERRQTDWQYREHGHVTESIEIKVRNHKAEDVTVRVKEPMYRWVNWKITAKSHDYAKLDARTVAFDVKVPKDGETTVAYTVEYTW